MVMPRASVELLLGTMLSVKGAFALSTCEVPKSARAISNRRFILMILVVAQHELCGWCWCLVLAAYLCGVKTEAKGPSALRGDRPLAPSIAFADTRHSTRAIIRVQISTAR